ncbi:MAG: AraC family transcriptional regulator [Clostridiales bacterium]|nr:AraC family transcriptional regulator [Clostridiales bacterium]
MGRKSRTIVEYRSYALPVSFPIIILTGDRWHISDIPSKRLHFHNCLELGMCHEGHGTLVFYDTPLEFNAGDVTCISQNVPHTTYSAKGSASLWSYIYLDPIALLGKEIYSLMDDTFSMRSFLCSSNLLQSENQHPELSWLFLQILKEMDAKKPGYEMIVRELSAALLSYLARLWNQTASKETSAKKDLHILQPAINYIHDHYLEQFDVNTLAEMCYISTTHFRRLFTAQVGTNPLNYVHQVRILESCNLLRNSELSISQIAEKVGYPTLSNFNRHFLSLMGCTPSSWRKISDTNAKPTILSYSGWTEAEKIPMHDADDTYES